MTSVKVTEVTPETFKASVPDAVLRVIVPPLPPNVTLWLGSSWLDVLAPCTRSEVTPENACAEKPVPLTEMVEPGRSDQSLVIGRREVDIKHAGIQAMR